MVGEGKGPVAEMEYHGRDEEGDQSSVFDQNFVLDRGVTGKAGPSDGMLFFQKLT